MKLRYKVGLVLTVLASMFLWGRCSRPKPTKPLVLPPGDSEQIRVDSNKHQLTVITPAGTKTVTLPDRVSTVDIKKNGEVKVTAPQLGFEAHPWLGAGYGQGLRLYAGADLAYWKRLDLGLGIAAPNLLDKSNQTFNDLRTGIFVSYNIWSNSRVTLGVDQQKAVHLLISVRV